MSSIPTLEYKNGTLSTSGRYPMQQDYDFSQWHRDRFLQLDDLTGEAVGQAIIEPIKQAIDENIINMITLLIGVVIILVGVAGIVGKVKPI